MPDFGPGTTRDEFGVFMNVLAQAQAELEMLESPLDVLVGSAPTPRVHANLQLVVDSYLACTAIGDYRQMEAVGSSMEEQNIEAERINYLTEELMAVYGASPAEAGYRFAN
jgi:hypothetical protein